MKFYSLKNLTNSPWVFESLFILMYYCGTVYENALSHIQNKSVGLFKVWLYLNEAYIVVATTPPLVDGVIHVTLAVHWVRYVTIRVVLVPCKETEQGSSTFTVVYQYVENLFVFVIHIFKLLFQYISFNQYISVVYLEQSINKAMIWYDGVNSHKSIRISFQVFPQVILKLIVRFAKNIQGGVNLWILVLGPRN